MVNVRFCEAARLAFFFARPRLQSVFNMTARRSDSDCKTFRHHLSKQTIKFETFLALQKTETLSQP